MEKRRDAREQLEEPTGADLAALFEAQTGPLRRLACSLVGTGGADDLVSDTWTAFLQRPPPQRGPSFGFLATVARRLASNARRADARRGEHEARAAQESSLAPAAPGPDAIAERAEALREVLEALVVLRDPYRDALWQRFFDGRSPAEIARRTGESPATVKSRLQRGLELLRQDLDRRHGGRRRDWAVALFPMGAPAAPIIAASGGVLGGVAMSSGAKLGVAMTLAVLCGLGWWWRDHGDVERRPEAVASATPRDALTDTVSRPTPASGPAVDSRNSVAEAVVEPDPPLAVAPELAHDHLYVLVVRTLDEYGLPGGGGSVFIAPAGASWNSAPPLVVIGGAATVTWRGRTPEMDVDVQVGDGDDVRSRRRLHLIAGHPNEVALLAPPQDLQTVSDLPLIAFYRISGGTAGAPENLLLERISPSSSRPEMRRFPHPHARFGDGFVSAAPRSEPEPEPEPEVEALLSASLLTSERRIELAFLDAQLSPGAGRLSPRLTSVLEAFESTSDEVGTSTIDVVVLDENGAPVPGARLALGREVGGSELGGFTDGEGRAVVEGVGEGWWEVHAGGDRQGLARERVFVTPPATLSLRLRLSRGARLGGRVIDAEGKPIPGAIVQYETTPTTVLRANAVRVTRETLGGEEIAERGSATPLTPGEWRAPWVDESRTDEDGRFEFANLPPGLGRVVVLTEKEAQGCPVWIEEGLLADSEVAIQIPASLGGISVRVVLPAEFEALVAPQVRVTHEASGRGGELTLRDGVYTSGPLAAGWYRVEVGAGALGWHDLGRHFVEGGCVDLGSFAPSPPARLRIECTPTTDGGSAQTEVTLYRRRADVDLRGEPTSLSPGEWCLPAGPYWIFWKDAEGRSRHRAIEVGGDAAKEGITVVDLRSDG